MKIRCFVLDVELLSGNFDAWVASLPKERREKCLRFVQKKDQLLSLGASLLIETFVGKGPYLYGKYGKPYKEGLAPFSVSHSGTYCFLAVSEEEVGADIEQIVEKDPKLVAYCFDEEEQKTISDSKGFFLQWCEKESLGKLLGFGMKDPKKTPVRPFGNGEVEFEGTHAYVIRGTMEGYAFAVASKGPFDIELHRVDLKCLVLS